MLWKLAAVDTFAPEIGRALGPGEGFARVGRGRMLGPELVSRRVLRPRPGERHKGLLSLAQGLGGVRARSFEAHAQVRDQPQRDVALAAPRYGLPVTRPGVLPLGCRLPIVEGGMAVEAQLDTADYTLRRAQEDVLSLVVGGRPAMRPRSALAVVPGADAQRVADDEPAGACTPCGIEGQGAGKVAAPRRHHDPAGCKPEGSGGAIEDGREHARAVGTRKAHPLDAAAGGAAGIDLAVGQERVLGDGREGACDMAHTGG